MPFFHRVMALLIACTLPAVALAQEAEAPAAELSIELNAMTDVDGACRLTFLARNATGNGIDKAVFETVIFDTEGGVVRLSLFDFRDLPADRPRVRQFDLPQISCAGIGQALINGANSCTVDGSESGICDSALTLGSRLDVELLG